MFSHTSNVVSILYRYAHGFGVYSLIITYTSTTCSLWVRTINWLCRNRVLKMIVDFRKKVCSVHNKINYEGRSIVPLKMKNWKLTKMPRCRPKTLLSPTPDPGKRDSMIEIPKSLQHRARKLINRSSQSLAFSAPVSCVSGIIKFP